MQIRLRQIMPYTILVLMLAASLTSGIVTITEDKIVYNTSPLTQFQYNSTTDTLEFTGNISLDYIKHYGETASYIIFKEGSTVYCKNGSDGHIEYSSSNASAVIQYTINQLPSGGRIYIKSGEYSILSKITLIDDIVIEGEGKTTILKNGVTRPNHLDSIFYAYNKENITIRDIYFNGCLSSLGTTGGSFEGAVDFQGGKYITIEDCIFYDWYSDSINIVQTTTYPSYYRITGNTITDCNGDAGIRISYGRHCIVSENKITGCTGIYIRDYSYYCTISNNVIQPNHGGVNIDSGDYTDSGIIVYTSKFNSIIGNTIYNSKIDNSGNGGIGININSADGNTIVGNTIYNCEGTGITVYNSNFNIVQSNLLANNCLNSSATNRDEIKVYATTSKESNKIIGNTIYETGGQKCRYGIYIDGNHSLTLVTDNNIRYISPAIVNSGTSTEIYDNLGFTTWNSGSTTIPSGSTSVVVSHNLAGTPTFVDVEPAGDIGYTWVTNVNSTSFTIHCSSAPTSDTTVYWSAEYKP